MTELRVAAHPWLSLGAFVLELPGPLGELSSPDWLRALAASDDDAPFSRNEEVRKAMRDLLRHGGYKPTGRGKPSAEYLARAVEKGPLPEINLVVDLINVVSLHAGLSISVVDLELLREPLTVRAADSDANYVFNTSGQTIQLGGLLCLHDADGPCANAVKDAQRTKTHPATRSVLMLVWGSLEVGARSTATVTWLRQLAERVGVVHPVELRDVEEQT